MNEGRKSSLANYYRLGSRSLLATGATSGSEATDSKGGGALRSCLWFSSNHLSISS